MSLNFDPRIFLETNFWENMKRTYVCTYVRFRRIIIIRHRTCFRHIFATLHPPPLIICQEIEFNSITNPLIFTAINNNSRVELNYNPLTNFKFPGTSSRTIGAIGQVWTFGKWCNCWLANWSGISEPEKGPIAISSGTSVKMPTKLAKLVSGATVKVVGAK